MVTYPSDWKVSMLGNIGTFTKGAPLSKADITETGTPFVLYGELYTTYNEVTYKIYRHTKRSVDSLYYSNVGDVIIPTSGETAEEIATACCIMVPGVILAGDLNIYRANGFDGRYVSYVINHVVNRQIADVAQGISIIHVNAKELKKIEIHYPDLSEQKAIADTLDTIDIHIANLTELIEKKKAIRDGALEDLVSGRTRLAGYTDVWNKTTIGACTEIFQGGTPSTANNRFWGGSVIWVTPSEITKLPTMYIDDSERKITEEGLQNSSAKLLPAGTILLCTRATIGDLAIARKPMTTNQGFKNLVCNPDVHNVFFAYLLRTLKPIMLSLAIGTTFLEISKRNLSSIEISIPDYPEQEAIAAVLTAMDDEIITLEDERDKMIQIREGAMDDLLTGRVRLSI